MEDNADCCQPLSMKPWLVRTWPPLVKNLAYRSSVNSLAGMLRCRCNKPLVHLMLRHTRMPTPMKRSFHRRSDNPCTLLWLGLPCGYSVITSTSAYPVSWLPSVFFNARNLMYRAFAGGKFFTCHNGLFLMLGNSPCETSFHPLLSVEM